MIRPTFSSRLCIIPAFIGLRWITFLEVVNEKRSFEEQEKSTRIRTIASDELKSLLSSGIPNYEDLCEKIILSEKYDFSFKEYLLHTSISQVPTDAQRGYLEENLIGLRLQKLV